MYGTAIKPINEEDDYDIDLVCMFTEAFDDLSPAYVKTKVGKRLEEHDTYRKMLDEEGRRCWTLQYSENLNFHMDILPAVPFSENYRNDIRLKQLYQNMSRPELSLLATDKNKDTKTYHYIPTNPRGYAEWFRERIQINADQAAIRSVERLPEYPKKTTLQKAIQLLKRHRDVYFGDDEESLKPISMIITTLTALCYDGEKNIYEFICKALENMDHWIIKDTNRKYLIQNPVMKLENFADKWNENPAKAQSFYEWLSKANTDFMELDSLSNYTDFERVFKKMFAQKPVDRLMTKYKTQLLKEKLASLCEETKSFSCVALEKVTHKMKPPWSLPKRSNVIIKAKRSVDKGDTYDLLTSGTILPKETRLIFFPFHNIHPPYTVKWQVTNTGKEATEKEDLRGEFCNCNGKEGDPLNSRKESTAYTGIHYVQCFITITKDNKERCVGVSEPFEVIVE
jgi:hypothetical protein